MQFHNLPEPSLLRATNMFGKCACLVTCGIMLYQSDLTIHQALSLILLTVALSWALLIKAQCQSMIFFPYRIMNRLSGILLREDLITAIIASLAAFHVVTLSSVAKVWALPLLLAKWQYGLFDKSSAIHSVLPSLKRYYCELASTPEILLIPVYNIRAYLRRIGQNIPYIPETRGYYARIVSLIETPKRLLIEDMLLWERRDVVFYIACTLFFGLWFFDCTYTTLPPSLLILPCLFLGSPFGRKTVSVSSPVIEKYEPRIESEEEYLNDPELNVPFWQRLNIAMCVYLSIVHVITSWWICFGPSCMWQTGLFAFLLWPISALGITAGAHRLWAHRSYEAGVVLRTFLMICNSMANQGTAYHWARDHRTHHLFSDTKADPYDATRGFFYSHVGWLLLKKHSAVVRASREYVTVDDLENDSILAVQRNLDPVWNLFWCFVFPASIARCWDESWLVGFVVPGVVRYVWLLHCTWAVNSVVHKYGHKVYQRAPEPLRDGEPAASNFHREDVTTENPWVSFLALGEGWHSWHHAFPWDYATAELGALQQYNPTKCFIDCCAWFGLAYSRKRATALWNQRKSRWTARAQGWRIVESLEGLPFFKLRYVNVEKVN